AASRVNQLIDIPSYAAAEVIFPKVSKASAEEGEKKVLYLFERMVAILLCFTIPTGLFIICFPKFIITLIAGTRYTSAALILQLYMLAGILRPFQNQSANLLNSIGKSALCFVINAVSLLVNLVINFICLKYIGFYGAAIGTVITCFLGMAAWYFIMQRKIGTNLGRIFVYMIESYQLMYKTALSFLKPKNANS
ncbi:MAG TPA: polysaccharide biosynthesis C-terminal domain-containing protein, partial [Puia sp.]